ncbi:hypothetical protein SAMN05660866_00482 [Maribacter arcticus]|uniref:Uncharacterized protein n=1 Tax=Maribacter arcticus TaxID=561365 RepID=A0A1T4ZY30_9FLAO|nr:hypothetical protein SAMN05660866_00482 [Maribacter arcticus]
MIILTLLIPALIVLLVVSFTSKNKKQLRAIKVPVNKRKF